ncbi:MAG TPA: M20/M25/M40 family metallo-hydrolase, partial [Vicinamibacterales bacterium]|nr:M20/M25/M40 family metallo-hydrolase [Vicinamibacterales bacterium]
CALVEGGVGISTYAPECRLEVERRTIPGESADEAVREIEAIVRHAAGEALVEAWFSRRPLLADRDSAIADAVREGVRAVAGHVPPEAGVAYWMDAALFAEAGIPTVAYGPCGGGAHEAEEWVSLASAADTARTLVEAARRFCGARPRAEV